MSEGPEEESDRNGTKSEKDRDKERVKVEKERRVNEPNQPRKQQLEVP